MTQSLSEAATPYHRFERSHRNVLEAFAFPQQGDHVRRHVRRHVQRRLRPPAQGGIGDRFGRAKEV
jgi:hypothetical protein